MDTSKIKETMGRASKSKGVLATAAVAALIGAGAIGYTIGDGHDDDHHEFGDEYGMHGFGPHGDDFGGFPPPPPGMNGRDGRPPIPPPGHQPRGDQGVQGAPLPGHPDSDSYDDQEGNEDRR